MPTLVRRRTAAALAIVSIGLSGILSGCAGTPGGAAPPPATPTPIATATATASTATGSPGPSASRPAPTTSVRASTPTAGAPTNRPTGTTSTVYAELVDVWRTGPESYALSYDRVDLLTGKAAAAYYREHPDKEPLDFAISNPDTALGQLPVAANGTFYGNQQLGPGNGSRTTRITGDQLIARLKTHPRTIVKVTERPSGNHREVVTVTEVYLP